MKSSRFSTIFAILRNLLSICSFILLLLIFTNTHNLSLHLPQSQEQLNSKWYCGNNATYARSHDCVFDVMLTTWLHKDCFYPDLMETYITTNNFNWSRDNTFTDLVPLSEISKGDHPHIYVDPEFHYVHCAYTWEMQLRAWQDRRPLIESLADPEHSMHCAELVTRHVLPRNETSLTVVSERCEVPGMRHESGGYGHGKRKK